MLGKSLTLFRIGYFGSARGWERTKMTSLLPKICHTYPTTIKLGTVLPYLKKIKKTNGKKRYQQSATFVVFRNFVMSDLKNSIFKMTFSKFKCSQNYLETSLPTWQSTFTILYYLQFYTTTVLYYNFILSTFTVLYYHFVGCLVKFLILAVSLPS